MLQTIIEGALKQRLVLVVIAMALAVFGVGVWQLQRRDVVTD